MDPGRSGSSQSKNTRPDHRADSQRDQTPHSQRSTQPLPRLLGSRDQLIDTLRAKKSIHKEGGGRWVVGGGKSRIGIFSHALDRLPPAIRSSILFVPLRRIISGRPEVGVGGGKSQIASFPPPTTYLPPPETVALCANV